MIKTIKAQHRKDGKGQLTEQNLVKMRQQCLGEFWGNIARNMYIKVPTVIKIEIIYISTNSDKNKATR